MRWQEAPAPLRHPAPSHAPVPAPASYRPTRGYAWRRPQSRMRPCTDTQMGHGPCRWVSKDDNCVRPRHDRAILRSGPFRWAVQDVLFPRVPGAWLPAGGTSSVIG